MASTKSPASGEGRIALSEGYELDIRADMTAAVFNAQGKELASVPPKVRKSDVWQQWMSLRENHRQRLADNERVVVGWMIGREMVAADVLASLMRDPAWRARLKGLLVTGTDDDGRVREGLILDGDPDKGLGLFTLDLDSEWVAGGRFRIRHPATDTSDLTEWRRCATDNGIEQGTPQLMRAVHQPTSAEKPSRKSDRFADRTLESAAFVSHSFNRREWATSAGVASREFVVYPLDGEGEPERYTARFEYFAGGDYGDWNMECTTGKLEFVDASGEVLRIKDVPPVVFSEACTDINSIISH